MLELGSQCRRIKLSAWGCRCGSGLEDLKVEVSNFRPVAPAVGLDLKFWALDFRLWILGFGFWTLGHKRLGVEVLGSDLYSYRRFDSAEASPSGISPKPKPLNPEP